MLKEKSEERGPKSQHIFIDWLNELLLSSFRYYSYLAISFLIK